MNDVVLIIPVYNEENTISTLLKDLLLHTSNIIIVNDGSTDRSEEICRKFPIITINNKNNLGKGRSLVIGMKYAIENYPSCHYVVTLDGDLQHSPQDLPRLLHLSKKSKYAIIIGKRIPFSSTKKFPYFRRYLVTVITSKFVNFFFPLGITDLQSGYRIYNRKCIPMLLAKTKSSKFQFETEILIQAWSLRFPIIEVPIKRIYFSKNSSKVNSFLDTFRWIKLVLRALLVYPKLFSRRRNFSPTYRINFSSN